MIQKPEREWAGMTIPRVRVGGESGGEGGVGVGS